MATELAAGASRADAAVEISAYSPAWPQQFGTERALLLATLGRWAVAEIQHIGSTAVPGLAAKPVIDIMLPVASLAASVEAIPQAQQCGYLHWPYRDDVMHWFCKPSPAHRTHHLHLVPCGNPLWFQRLAFRDALRSDAALADEYARLKVTLAAQFRDDREAYTQGKTPFIERVLANSPRHG